MHKGTYLVTFKTSSKSSMGLESFEKMIGQVAQVQGMMKKTYSASVKLLSKDPEKIIDMLEKNGIEVRNIRTDKEWNEIRRKEYESKNS